MLGYVKTKHFFFERKQLAFRPFFYVGDIVETLLEIVLVLESIKERELAVLPVFLYAAGDFHRLIENGDELGAVQLERIECAAFYKAFDYFSVYDARVDVLAEMVERFESVFFLERGFIDLFLGVIAYGSLDCLRLQSQ